MNKIIKVKLEYVYVILAYVCLIVGNLLMSEFELELRSSAEITKTQDMFGLSYRVLIYLSGLFIGYSHLLTYKRKTKEGIDKIKYDITKFCGQPRFDSDNEEE